MEGSAEEARINEIVAEMRRLDARLEALSDELFDILDRLRRVSTEPEQST